MMSKESIRTGMGVKVYRYTNNNNNSYETLEACGLSYKGYKIMVHNRDDETIDIVTVMLLGNRRFYTCTCDKDNRCKHISIAGRYIRECTEHSKNSKHKRNKRNKHKR